MKNQLPKSEIKDRLMDHFRYSSDGGNDTLIIHGSYYDVLKPIIAKGLIYFPNERESYKIYCPQNDLNGFYVFMIKYNLDDADQIIAEIKKL